MPSVPWVISHFAAAMILFAGVVSALYERERTGIGQKVEASLLAGALSLQGNSVHHIEAAESSVHLEPCQPHIPRDLDSKIVHVFAGGARAEIGFGAARGIEAAIQQRNIDIQTSGAVIAAERRNALRYFAGHGQHAH